MNSNVQNFPLLANYNGMYVLLFYTFGTTHDQFAHLFIWEIVIHIMVYRVCSVWSHKISFNRHKMCIRMERWLCIGVDVLKALSRGWVMDAFFIHFHITSYQRPINIKSVPLKYATSGAWTERFSSFRYVTL